MKRLLSLLKYIPLTLLLSPSVFASVDHFEVIISPEEGKAGDFFDLTIDAVDSDGNTDFNYTGSVLIFSESDPEADFPGALAENSYTFTASDEGKVKFENAVKFKSSGVQDIYIYDLNDDNIVGVGEVVIQEDAGNEKINIEILNPSSGLTIGKTETQVSGETKRNHSVKIVINGEQEFTTVSNTEGIFDKEVIGLKNGENSIQAFVLNADNEVVGESSLVSLKVEAKKPSLNSFKITPEAEAEPNQKVNISLLGTANLSQVQVVMNDVIIDLEENESGIYTGDINAPSEAGTYGINVILKDELGNQTVKNSIKELSVIELAPQAAAEIEEKTPEEPKEIDLTIKHLTLTKLKTKSVLKWDAIAGVKEYKIFKKMTDGGLEVFATITENHIEIPVTGDEVSYEYFAVQAVSEIRKEVEKQDISGDIVIEEVVETLEGDLSEATKIQTGPKEMILVLISLFAVGIFMFIRRGRREY